MSAKRIYSEEEVARLIRRAVELEADRSVAADEGAGTGLTISEIEQVAAEAGIDPELIQKAASELESGAEPGYSSTDPAGQVSSRHREKGKTEIRSNEIFCERWIDVQPDNDTINSLVTELNHRFGTSDDISWWDKLWDSYEGKAKIRKTPGCLDWHYTDEWQYYSTRVLLQKRGERFRIRVSKRQSWGFDWKSDVRMYWIMSPVFLVLGGVLGYSLMDSALPGIAAGIAMLMAAYPFARMYNARHVNRHKDEVTSLADDLADYTVQMMEENRHLKKGKSYGKDTATGSIEIGIEADDEYEGDENIENKRSTVTRPLRNHLK